MEELIDLLEEFNKEMGWHPGLLYEGFGVREGDLNFIFNHSEFPFIKWLVDNDKIDMDMVREKFGIPCFVWYTEGEVSCVNDKEDYKQLLMLLSISDTPIDDLISYLR